MFFCSIFEQFYFKYVDVFAFEIKLNKCCKKNHLFFFYFMLDLPTALVSDCDIHVLLW